MKNIRNEAKSTIVEYIDQYYSNYRAIPSVRDIAAGTGISVSTVHRCLKDMKENGELEYRGRRSVSTRRIEMEGYHPAMAVLGYVACGEGQGVAQHGTVCRFSRLRHGEHGRLLQKERRAVRLNEHTAGEIHQ